MATMTPFDCLVADLAHKAHDLSTDTIKAMLSNTAPSAAWTAKSSVTEIAAGNGYTAGGATVTITSSGQTGGVYKLVLADIVWTATGGSIGPFRYVILYNDTHASDRLLWSYDYGSAITKGSGETFTVDFDPTNGALILQAA